jgi:hypothetical protein
VEELKCRAREGTCTHLKAWYLVTTEAAEDRGRGSSETLQRCISRLAPWLMALGTLWERALLLLAYDDTSEHDFAVRYDIRATCQPGSHWGGSI